MWNKPDRIIETLNKQYKGDDWNLEFIERLNGGYSGAVLFLCQDRSGLGYVVVKSFYDKDSALLEWDNNFKASRRFRLPVKFLTNVTELSEGACFCMRLAGGEDGKPFSKIIKTALNTNNSMPAIQIVNSISSKLRRPIPQPMIKDAFSHIEFDENFKRQLQALNSKLYNSFVEWWEEILARNDHRQIAFTSAHGDMHADNIFVVNEEDPRDGDVHLIDFGSYGEHPILKDFARLERDIRFRLFENSLPQGERAVEKYLKDQDCITKSSLNKTEDVPEELKTVVELVRSVEKNAKDFTGGDTSFEYDYVRFFEFLFFAASPIENRATELQRTAAFRSAMMLTKRIDDYYEEDARVKQNAVLWQLAYAFLRLEQLPSGGWARSLPNWLRTLMGDSEESRSKEFGLRYLGGMNLTCAALLNYMRTLCNVLGKRPEDILKSWQGVGNNPGQIQNLESQETEQLLSDLRQIEVRNQVCNRVIQHIYSRINTEGAIPASQLVRDVDTEVHHTLLGIIVLQLAYLLSGRTFEKYFCEGIIRMCEYLTNHGKNVRQPVKRRYEIYCALIFLQHLLSFEFFQTESPEVRKTLHKFPEILNIIRTRIFEGGQFFAYPNMEKNTSGFLMNLPLMVSLSGYRFLEEDAGFVTDPFDRIRLDADGLVRCKMNGKHVSDWGHTAEYWWAKTRFRKGTNDAHHALQTLNAQLTKQKVLSLTHGVSFSYVLGLCKPLDPKALRKLDEQVNTVFQTGATERSLFGLITWIYHQEYETFPLLKQDLEKDRNFLEAIPRGHKLFPVANDLKNLFISKLQLGGYIPTKNPELAQWQSVIEKSIEDTKKFFEDDLGKRNNEICERLLPNKNWFHLFNYLGHESGTDAAWVFDVGCGSGVHAIKEFIPKGYRVHFFDCSQRVLNRVGDKLKEIGISDEKYILTKGSIEDIAHPNAFEHQLHKGCFKVIFADAVLFHIAKGQVPDILSRFHILLADDGILFANFKINDHTLIGIDGRLFEYYANYWEIQRMFENAGFFVDDVTMTMKRESMYGIPYPTSWTHFICRKQNEENIN